MSRFRITSLIVSFFVLVLTVSSGICLGSAGMEFKKTPLSEKAEPMMEGKFAPTWESLCGYECPDWFRNAKFGIWAHWGPQCQPERGDWYARHMYVEGHWQGNEHRKLYGHPLRVWIQGCHQRMEGRQVGSGGDDEALQKGRCPVFLCYGQPS